MIRLVPLLALLLLTTALLAGPTEATGAYVCATVRGATGTCTGPFVPTPPYPVPPPSCLSRTVEAGPGLASVYACA